MMPATVLGTEYITRKQNKYYPLKAYNLAQGEKNVKKLVVINAMEEIFTQGEMAE